ncbi:MAG: VC0807 family protein [Paludibacteraceae bacterium]|nr:VC0807 family protein [Paludibacteraceae bacterium]
MSNPNTKAKENPLLNILFSIVIPAIILSKFSTPEKLGVIPGFLIALAFPIGMSLYELIVQKKVSFIAILGFVSILLTGIIGILEIPTQWLAVKEAAVPLLIGLAVIVSQYTKYPLIEKLIYNNQLLKIALIEERLQANGNTHLVKKIMRNATWMVAASFLVSTVLNYSLTKYIVVSPAGTEAFNQELGKLTALSYPAIALPSTLIMVVALWYLVSQLKKATGLSMEEMLAIENS